MFVYKDTVYFFPKLWFVKFSVVIFEIFFEISGSTGKNKIGINEIKVN